MDIVAVVMRRRIRAFLRSPHKARKIRDSYRDLSWRARTAWSRQRLWGYQGRLIAITGTKGKTTTTRLISRIFADAGYQVGMACSGGIYINGACTLSGSFSGAEGPLRAYRAGGRDLLVLETAHGGIHRYGFGFRHCDVAVFTNITDGHLGELGIETLDEMVALKWKLASTVRSGGMVILNADDPRLASLHPPRGVKVAYLSLKPPIQERASFGATFYRYDKDDGTGCTGM